ncbi:MAG: SPOR domain-containing protein [Legionellaceae bacterium]|nr:SPOR domain-containing protein [Legionellaceae bacterium]
MANYPNTKRNTGRSSVRMRKQSQKHFFMGLFLAFVCGYLAAWLYSPAHITKAAQLFFGGSQSLEVLDGPSVKTADLPKPKLEFYTLLTQEKAALPAKPVAVQPPVKAPVAPQQPKVPAAVVAPQSLKVESAAQVQPISKYTYLVQLASFQRQEDAEQMKASLIMRGFDASIKTAKQQGGVWYRVVMGPFPSRQKAEQIKSEIAQSERVSGIIRRMDA